MFVGCGRSGTTLFRNVFNAHPDLTVTHEAHFVGPMAAKAGDYDHGDGFDVDGFVSDLFTNPNFIRQGLDESEVRNRLANAGPDGLAEAIRTVYSLLAEGEGKSLYGDKTPGSVSYIAEIATVFPEAKFVHIIRDGRAVALSYLERPEWGPETMAEAAHHWKSRISRGRSGAANVGRARYREVHYEDMVEDPARVTRELCEFLGIEFRQEMLQYHQEGEEFISGTKDPAAFKNLAKPVTKGLRKWEDQISPSDLELFESIAGDLLDELGYGRRSTARGPKALLVRLVTSIAWQWKRVATRVSKRLG